MTLAALRNPYNSQRDDTFVCLGWMKPVTVAGPGHPPVRKGYVALGATLSAAVEPPRSHELHHEEGEADGHHERVERQARR
jgi:hypothetical protein